MARPRKPTALLELTGAFRKDPQRWRGAAPQPTGPLGAPPDRLEPAEKKCWLELEALVPPGILFNSDRWHVEITACLLAKMRDPRGGLGGKHGLRAGEVRLLNKCLTQMGMTPADRSRIAIIKEDESDNPFAQLPAPKPPARRSN